MAGYDIRTTERTTAASDWLKPKTTCIISDAVVFDDNEPKTVLGFVFVLVLSHM